LLVKFGTVFAYCVGLYKREFLCSHCVDGFCTDFIK
jgi:hypothetical protein